MFHFLIFLVPCSEKLTLLPQARFLSDWQWESGLNRNSPPLNAGSLPWEALDAAAQLLVCQRDVIRLLQSAALTPNNLTSEKCVCCISKKSEFSEDKKAFQIFIFHNGQWLGIYKTPTYNTNTNWKIPFKIHATKTIG